jgi:prevent-host-death family protein
MYKIEKGGGDMPQIRPITDLRNTAEISEICHSNREPVFITKNGYGDLVIMSIDTYERMLETAAVDAAISEAETDLSNGGQLHDAIEALGSLRRKHFG